MRVITSIYQLTLKFSTPDGVGSIKGCQFDSRECNKEIKGFQKLYKAYNNEAL